MSRGSQAIGLVPDPNEAYVLEDTSPATDVETHDIHAEIDVPETPEQAAWDADDEGDEADQARTPRGPLAWRIIAGLAASGWVGAYVYAHFGPALLQGEGLFAAISALSGPLVLIALAYILLARTDGREAHRLHANTAALRNEQYRLAEAFAMLEGRLAGAQSGLDASAANLATLADNTHRRLEALNGALGDEIETLGKHGETLRRTVSTARGDVGLLLSDLPRAETHSRKLRDAIESSGHSAIEQANKLGLAVEALVNNASQAQATASTATAELAAHLTQVTAARDEAAARLNSAASTLTDRIDTALEHAAQSSEAARDSLNTHSAAIVALVDQAKTALARTGGDSAAEVAAHVSTASEQLDMMTARLASHSATTGELMGGLRDGLTALDSQFDTLDKQGAARHDRLATSIGKVSDQSAALLAQVEEGRTSAKALAADGDALNAMLGETAGLLNDQLPASFARLGEHGAATKAIVTGLTPALAALEARAASSHAHIDRSQELLGENSAAIEALGARTSERLASTTAAAAALIAEIERADGASRALSETASVQLVEALLRVRETAQAAAERARDAISAVIPDAAARLNEAAHQAIGDSVQRAATDQIAAITRTADAALASASAASDKLMRQMLTISETSAALEARVTDAQATLANDERDGLARRVALLTESLNSTAIDVTKILSNDVTDTEWAAYLRGDRGVFTRRAVKLLDAGEARTITRHYENDPEFREQVNRYIHDFEAMLRGILASRDGSALSVTLLSSDMGKLYVALAQAIERLRR